MTAAFLEGRSLTVDGSDSIISLALDKARPGFGPVGASLKRQHIFVALLIATLGGNAVPQPARPPLLPAGPAPDLSLVFTSQVVGWVEPCG